MCPGGGKKHRSCGSSLTARKKEKMGLEFMASYHRAGTGSVREQIWVRLYPIRMLLLFLFFIVYLAIGAAIFVVVEAPSERNDIRKLVRLVDNFINSHKTCLMKSEFFELLSSVSSAAQRGVSVELNGTMESNWNFGQSFFYCGTLWLLEKLTIRFGHLYHESQIRLIHLVAVTLFILMSLFVLPAAVFQSIEDDWTYLDAFYYCFVSLTTIGLGDYIPGDKPNQKFRDIYKIMTTGYLIIGLLGMMLFLSVVYEVPELNVSRFLISDSANLAEKERLRALNSMEPSYTRHLDESDTSQLTPDQPGYTNPMPDYEYGY
ncbi:Potassium channel subfamily K member 1 [Trichinella pseudospiralis]|uniref:Potassium channel subfamily K member 1 n=1 Tax=Trichinella pseudospiralis TaxID=6337 RepID=A0A0V0YA16_TRIPS|nr:Potassium channel subfamily K member 1 [Trichinella pseudospiralis]